MALRKLQAEIDRTLKTVAAGVEVFEDTFDKLNKASNATQKDKLENDLKTQIKKLQRMRDQIKAWLGSSDIKDKTALMEHRRLIEQQMERFKALEKEMKMKAFSKEGLIAQSRLDPAEKAKRDMIDWIGTTVDELSRQIEQTEAEMEGLQTTGKKKKQAGDRLGEMEEINERRVWHNGRLEVVQRMLENGQLSCEQVEAIQEDIKYFVEANTEEDFDYDVGIYDELNLQDEDEYLQDYPQNDELSNLDSSSVVDASESTPAPKTPAREDKEKDKEKEKEKKPTPAGKQERSASTPGMDEPPSPTQGKKQPSRKSTIDSTKAEPMRIVGKSDPPPPVPTVPVPAPKASLPPIRYAAAVAGSVVASSVPASSPGSAAVQSPSVEAAASPLKPKADPMASALMVESPTVEEHTDPLSAPSPIVERASPAAEPETVPQANGHTQHPPPPPGLPAVSPAPVPVHSTQPLTSPQPPPAGPSPSQPAAYPQHAESSRAGAYVTSPRHPPGVMGNLMQSFEVAKELSERRAGDLNELHAALDGSLANAPLQSDSEPPRYYHPRNPVKTPSYYPQTKLSLLQEKGMYERLELDQLFFIFYYMTGTYEQWCAAQELKRQSWRFHKQYLTWFQRAHNPQAITEDYEQGGYYYFDWENSWCQRKKSDFRFEYRWLSDH